MNIRRQTLLPVFAVVLALPALANASSIWHPAANEAGVTYQPEHFKSSKTRDDAAKEVAAARKDGTLSQGEHVVVQAAASSGPGKTRQQVVDEMRNASPQERRARMEMSAGA